jgi:hypothetical protein
MSEINMDVINGYLIAAEKINQAKFDFLCARDAQRAAVRLMNYMTDEFCTKKNELAQAKLDAKPAFKSYKKYCDNKEIK